MKALGLILITIFSVSTKVADDRTRLICHRWTQVASRSYGAPEKERISQAGRTEITFSRNGNFERVAFSNGVKKSIAAGKWQFNYDRTKLGFVVSSVNSIRQTTSTNMRTDIEIIKLTSDSLILRNGSYYQKENKRSKIYVYNDSYFLRVR